MNETLSMKVMAVLLGHLRTTDHIGWYREGWTIGALLTLVDRTYVERQGQFPDQRLGPILQATLPNLADSLSVRMCGYEELIQFKG
ncbi:MAG TPA: hypothetical protein PKD12_00380 [Nitrospira sp.]|nr:hypothetical protein [Nitrospira sp.]